MSINPVKAILNITLMAFMACVIMGVGYVTLPPGRDCHPALIDVWKDRVAAHEICKNLPSCFLAETDVYKQIQTKRKLAQCNITIRIPDNAKI